MSRRSPRARHCPRNPRLINPPSGRENPGRFVERRSPWREPRPACRSTTSGGSSTSCPAPDEAARGAARARDATLTKPPGSLGRLEEIAEWLAAWQGREPPAVTRPLVAVFAANHGVAARGVSAYPQAVTRQMVANFAAGGAAINQICNAYDLGLKVFELALDQPTPDIVVEDAFDEKACAATIAYGMEAIAGGVDLLCLGEMGIANTTVAAAIFHALYGGEAADWVGRGTGVDDDGPRAQGGRGRRRGGAHRRASATRSKCCAASAGARSPPWPAPSWRRGASACR